MEKQFEVDTHIFDTDIDMVSCEVQRWRASSDMGVSTSVVAIY